MKKIPYLVALLSLVLSYVFLASGAVAAGDVRKAIVDATGLDFVDPGGMKGRPNGAAWQIGGDDPGVAILVEVAQSNDAQAEAQEWLKTIRENTDKRASEVTSEPLGGLISASFDYVETFDYRFIAIQGTGKCLLVTTHHRKGDKVEFAPFLRSIHRVKK